MEKKKTVGAHALELMQKTPEKISVIDQQQAMTEDYMKNLFEAVDNGYVKFAGNFYVTVITKQEKLMPNVFRNYFASRSTCPTPDYDQTVFRYNREKGQIEYIWTIPTKDACLHLLANRLQVVEEEKELLGYVLAFQSGKLAEVALKFNGEIHDASMTQKHDDKQIILS